MRRAWSTAWDSIPSTHSPVSMPGKPLRYSSARAERLRSRRSCQRLPVTGDTGAAYSYDSNGYRTDAGYRTGTDNQLTTDGTYTYAYDAEGDLVQKSKGAGQETWYYAYDNRDHLISVRETSDGTTNILTATYAYDAQDNRVQQQEWISGGSMQTTRYVVDRGQVWAEMDGTNAVQYRYLWGDNTDQLLVRLGFVGADAGARLFTPTDNLGSVRAVQNGVGLEESIRYDAFGTIVERRNASSTLLVATAPSEAGSYAWTGRERDAYTNLQYNRARYYDLSSHRWISRDPLGFGGGDGNLYRYVWNASTCFADPRGLAAAPVNYDVGIFFPGREEVIGDKTNAIDMLYRAYKSPKKYELGVPNGLDQFNPFIAGCNVAAQIVVERAIERAIRSGMEKTFHIDLFGYSRGGPFAVLLTQEIRAYIAAKHKKLLGVIKVAFLGLLDPVVLRANPGISPAITQDVKEHRIVYSNGGSDMARGFWIFRMDVTTPGGMVIKPLKTFKVSHEKLGKSAAAVAWLKAQAQAAGAPF